MQISIDSSVSNATDLSITSKPIQSSEFYEAAIVADEMIVNN